ncbi:hypothetical protein NHH03_17730 [Stieleria sp. TO1_6]|uniref:hypothetical protein n=1 Tax=Stieleria tagensis TaxID=2956795 RepID=UPI00209A80FE|nr:hypothetical protein [Stieleria tagensis]MCO8123590.1 hypothetical protein [Stieleria tagensis]
MTNSQRLATVRAHLQRWISENVSPSQSNADQSDAGIVSESILIRDGFYSGRTFDATTHRATWFMEPDELKIQGPDGDVVAVFRGEEIIAAAPQTAPQTAQRNENEDDSAIDDGPVSIPMIAAADVEVETQSDAQTQDAHDDDDALPQAA